MANWQRYMIFFLLLPCLTRCSAYVCVEAKCQSDEVQIDSHPSGSGKFACSCKLAHSRSRKIRADFLGGRLQVDCCKTVVPPPPSPLQCGSDLCDLRPGFCTPGENENDASDLSRREGQEYDDLEPETLEKRASQWMKFNLIGLPTAARPQRRANWPSRGELFDTDYRRRNVIPFVVRMRTADDCDNTRVETVPIDTSRPASEIRQLLIRENAQTDHVVDVGDLMIGSTLQFG
jgi:hypothetical protein